MSITFSVLDVCPPSSFLERAAVLENMARRRYLGSYWLVRNQLHMLRSSIDLLGSVNRPSIALRAPPPEEAIPARTILPSGVRPIGGQVAAVRLDRRVV